MIQRQLQEPSQGTLHSTYLENILKEGPPFTHLGVAAHELLTLAERGLKGDKKAFANYQAVLLHLHLAEDPENEAGFRWLASEVYRVEDLFFLEPTSFEAMPKDAFRPYIDNYILQKTRLKHPMSGHLYQGSPSETDIKHFLHHHWIRSYDFYRLLAELAFRFRDITDGAVFYRNLYGEAGAESPAKAHPKLLEKLMLYFELPTKIDFHTIHADEAAYLNNRLRCVRHPNSAWGLGLIYAVECVSRDNHRKIYEMLQKANVPEEYCEFHRLHGTNDEIDTEELWELIEKWSGDPKFQHTFMRSLARHFEVNRKYFDVLWDEMKG